MPKIIENIRESLVENAEKVLLEPGGGGWMNQFVYASHLVLWNNELRLYFNARETADMIKGRECIGFASAQL